MSLTVLRHSIVEYIPKTHCDSGVSAFPELKYHKKNFIFQTDGYDLVIIINKELTSPKPQVLSPRGCLSTICM